MQSACSSANIYTSLFSLVGVSFASLYSPDLWLVGRGWLGNSNEVLFPSSFITCRHPSLFCNHHKKITQPSPTDYWPVLYIHCHMEASDHLPGEWMVLLMFDRYKSRTLQCKTSSSGQLKIIILLSLIIKLKLKLTLVGMLHYFKSQNITQLHWVDMHSMDTYLSGHYKTLTFKANTVLGQLLLVN